MDQMFVLQAWGAVVYTIFASMGCFQEMFWNRVAQKERAKNRKTFLKNQA